MAKPPTHALAPNDVDYLALCAREYCEALKRPLTPNERRAFRFLLPLMERRQEGGSTCQDLEALRKAIDPAPIAAKKPPRKDLSGARCKKARGGLDAKDGWSGVTYVAAPSALTRAEVRERLQLARELVFGVKRIQAELQAGGAAEALGYGSWGDFAAVELAGVGVKRKRAAKPKVKRPAVDTSEMVTHVSKPAKWDWPRPALGDTFGEIHRARLEHAGLEDLADDEG